MEEYREPSFWSIIPDPILSSTKLKANAKLLYAKITSLQSARGYCFASNRYLGDGLGIAADTVTRLLRDLQETGFIRVEVIRDPETNATLERRIYSTIPLPDREDPLPDKYPIPSRTNIRYPEEPETVEDETEPPQSDQIPTVTQLPVDKPGEESGTDFTPPSRINIRYPPGQISDTLPDKHPSRDIKIENKEENPPIAPQGAGRKKKKEKSIPSHKPDRFEGFWKFYPRHEDRVSAVKEWDKLKPSDELINQMAVALTQQKKLPQWKDKTKIPYACRWLKNQRWMDDCAEPPDVSNLDTHETGGWAEDREVI